jgi:hypothetical protein
MKIKLFCIKNFRQDVFDPVRGLEPEALRNDGPRLGVFAAETELAHRQVLGEPHLDAAVRYGALAFVRMKGVRTESSFLVRREKWR